MDQPLNRNGLDFSSLTAERSSGPSFDFFARTIGDQPSAHWAKKDHPVKSRDDLVVEIQGLREELLSHFRKQPGGQKRSMRSHIRDIAVGMTGSLIAAGIVYTSGHLHETQAPAMIQAPASVERTLSSSDLSLWSIKPGQPAALEGTVQVSVQEDQRGSRTVEVDSPQTLNFTFQPDASTPMEGAVTFHQRQESSGHLITTIDLPSPAMRILIQPAQSGEVLGFSEKDPDQKSPPDTPTLIYDGGAKH